jgi:choline dehydrogenase-like flavoprotein
MTMTTTRSLTLPGGQGWRVVDASIFAEIPSTPTNLTTIMLAEHRLSRERLDMFR